MKKRNLILRAAVVAAFAISSSAAFAAAVDLSASPVVPAKFATELLSANVALANTAHALDLTGSIGWGVAAGAHLYIRVDLTNGKFAEAPALAITTGGGSATLSAGGAAASTFAIFDVSGTAAIALTDSFTLFPSTGITPAMGLTLTDPTQPITASVKFYTDSTLASTNGTALGTSLSGSYATSAAALTTTFTPLANTALVATNFKTFAARTAPAAIATGPLTLLGQISTSVSATALVPDTGATVSASDLATANDLVLSGDFSAVGTTGAIFVDTAASCSATVGAASSPAAAGSSFTLNTGKTTATLTGYADASLANSAINVCYLADGLTAIPEQAVSAVQTYTGLVSPAVIAAASGTVGTIVRDGTTLVAPLAQNPSAFSSRMILTNAGAIARPYTLSLLTEAGNTTTLVPAAATGSIPAGSTTVVNLVNILANATAGAVPRAGLKVIVGGPKAEISGMIQSINLTTSSLSNYIMVNP
jgi:hypothetical protein